MTLKSKSSIKTIFMLRIKVVLTIFLLFSIFTQFPIIKPVSSQSIDSKYLTVFLAPNTVPADGDEYGIIVVQMQNSAGFPIPASSDTIILLTSSSGSVGDVERTITIPKGSSFNVAKFKTTRTPGTTTITAVATGFEPNSADVITIDPSSSPMKLAVELAPKQLLPELDSKGTVVVQLQDANGLLARSLDDIVVSLSSSNPSVAIVNSSILIKAGQSYNYGYFYTTLNPGTSSITASSSGFTTDSELLTVKGPTPVKLAVYSGPPEIPERSGIQSSIAVQLQDVNGVPVRSPIDVEVTLTISDTLVGSILDSVITIEKGQTYTTTQFRGLELGTAEITATAQKYAAGFSTISVVRPGLANKGSLSLYLSPSVVIPDANLHQIIYVQLKDDAGTTVRADGDIEIHLSSSNTEVGTVESDITISSGSTYAIATFQSTHAAGTTEITASAADFVTASEMMIVSGAVPDSITMTVIPSQIPSDGGSHTALVLQLQNSLNEPANAPSDVVVTLSSTNTAIGTVDNTVVLSSGTSTTTATFYSTLLPGSTTITASASGYNPLSVLVKTVEPAPSNLFISIMPPIIPAGDEADGIIIVQLLDSAGLPARARYDVPILLSSSRTSVGESDSNVILHEGDTFVKANFQTSGESGTTKITVLSSGFAGSSSILSTVLYPLSLSFLSDELTVNISSTAELSIFIHSSGVPVPDTIVSWSSDSGYFTNEQVTTNMSGIATTEFQHDTSSAATINVVVTKRGYASVSDSIMVDITLLPLTISLPSTSIIAQLSEPIALIATVESKDQLIPEAFMSWTTSSGVISRTLGETDVDGKHSNTFYSNDVGDSTITLTASKVGYIDTSAVITVIIAEPIIDPIDNTTDTTINTIPNTTIFGLDLVALVGLIVAIIVVVVVAVLVLRRRRSSGKLEELEEGDLGDLLDDEE
ncbi:hypothetical protein ACFL96_11460 [Thermoproteota archaeon]